MHERNLHDAACTALVERDVGAKLALVTQLAQELACGALVLAPTSPPLDPAVQVGRPERPALVHPRELHKRSTTTLHGRAALLHSIAHIEHNAVNLALDAVWRFRALPYRFYADWIGVAAEEAHHFRMLREHLQSCGFDYGDFPAHDGLWEMAVKTAHDPLVRMALVPRVLEARGLDASPAIIRRLQESGDVRGVEILRIILHDEVGHVTIGTRWFEHLCAHRGCSPEETFIRLLAEYAAPRPTLPLNLEARRRAGFSERELATLASSARGRPAP